MLFHEFFFMYFPPIQDGLDPSLRYLFLTTLTGQLYFQILDDISRKSRLSTTISPGKASKVSYIVVVGSFYDRNFCCCCRTKKIFFKKSNLISSGGSESRKSTSFLYARIMLLKDLGSLHYTLFWSILITILVKIEIEIFPFGLLVEALAVTGLALSGFCNAATPVIPSIVQLSSWHEHFMCLP